MGRFRNSLHTFFTRADKLGIVNFAGFCEDKRNEFRQKNGEKRRAFGTPMAPCAKRSLAKPKKNGINENHEKTKSVSLKN